MRSGYKSTPGIGSTFTLYLPQIYVAVQTAVKMETVNPTSAPMIGAPPLPMDNGLTSAIQSMVDVVLPPPATAPATIVEDLAIDDDRNVIAPGDRVLLIVEDDLTFARILLDLAREHQLKALVALRGSIALALAREFKPGAITLDINLPDMAGWTILDRLKHDPVTRHVPVHIITGDENRRRGLALGAMTYLEKERDEGLPVAGILDDRKLCQTASEKAAADYGRCEVTEDSGAGNRRHGPGNQHGDDRRTGAGDCRSKLP